MNKDLTNGKPFSLIWRFCLPLFASVIFQQMYNIADSLVAGRFIGESALAAVGNSYEVTLIYIAIAFGCNIGCSVVASHCFGGKRYEELKTTVTTTFLSVGVLCVVMITAGLVFMEPLLSLINTPENIMADSAAYLRIYIISLPFVFYYNVANGVFTALGDSKTPFAFLTVSSLANIAMDILFVTVCRDWFARGVEAVAWATFICQGISGVCAVGFVMKRIRAIETRGKAPVFSWRIFKQIAVVAVPSMLQQSFISIGNIVIQGIINAFGSSVIAGYSGAIKLNNLVITAFTTLGNGISNYSGQNLGAKKPERIKGGFRAGCVLSFMLALPFVIAYFFFGRELMMIFLDGGEGEAVQTGVTLLRILAPFYFVVSVKLVSDGILRGAGKMKQFMIDTFSDLILRVVLAMVLSVPFGATGIWMAWPVGWFVGMTLSIIFYRKNGWDKA